MRRHSPPPRFGRIRLAGWLAAATLAAPALAGCAPALRSAPQPGPPPATPTAFDGTYEGTRSPDNGCGFAGPVGYQVAGGSIWQPTRNHGHAMDGAVEPDGRFQLGSDPDGHVVAGRISGDRLAATDTFPIPRYKHERSIGQVAQAACTARISANRVATGRPAAAR